jgi:hypothetical protein
MIMYPLIGLIPPHLCVCPNPRHGSPRTRWMILYPIVIFHILILTFHSEIYFKMLARQLDQQIHNKLHEIHSCLWSPYFKYWRFLCIWLLFRFYFTPCTFSAWMHTVVVVSFVFVRTYCLFNPRHGSPRTRWMILYPIVLFHILILTFYSEIYFKMLARP